MSQRCHYQINILSSNLSWNYLDNKNQKKSFYKQFCLGAEEVSRSWDLGDLPPRLSHSCKPVRGSVKDRGHPCFHGHRLLYFQ